jgi:hypothetical protein
MAELNPNIARYHFQVLAPQISGLTGLEPSLDSLDVRLIERGQFWEQAVEPGMKYLGIDTVPRDERARGVIAVLNRIQSKAIGGLYEPRLRQYFFFPENLKDANDDGLAVMIGHEFSHGTQFSATPEFYSVLQDLTKMALGSYYFDQRTGGVPEAIPLLNEMMTLIEGYATFYQNALNQLYYPEAVFSPRTESSSFNPAVDYNSLMESIPGFKEFRKMLEKQSFDPADLTDLVGKIPSPEELQKILEKTPELKSLSKLFEESPELKEYHEILEEFPSLKELEDGAQPGSGMDKMKQYQVGAQIMAEAFNRGGPEATLALFDDSCRKAKSFIESYKTSQANRSRRISDGLSRLKTG